MDQSTNPTIFDYSVTPGMSVNLKEAAKWCRFLSIVGFIFLGILLIGGVVAAPMLVSVLNTYLPGQFSIMAGALVGILIVAVLFGLFLFVLLFRFSVFTRRAVDENDESLFIKGLRSLKLYFIIYGVIGILSVLANISSLFK